MPESGLLADIIGLCESLRLLVFHSGDSRRDTGRGFPDIVICSRTGKGLLFVELKDFRRSLSLAQTDWHWSLAASGADWRLWRPDDWPEIEAACRALA